MWSVGCIFAELILKEPLLTGKNEADQLQKVSSLYSLLALGCRADALV